MCHILCVNLIRANFLLCVQSNFSGVKGKLPKGLAGAGEGGPTSADKDNGDEEDEREMEGQDLLLDNDDTTDDDDQVKPQLLHFFPKNYCSKFLF